MLEVVVVVATGIGSSRSRSCSSNLLFKKNLRELFVAVDS